MRRNQGKTRIGKLGLLVLICSSAYAVAQQTPAQTSPAPASAPYVDRIMDSVRALDEADQAPPYNSDGWARGLSLQFTRNVQTANSGTAAFANNRTQTQGFQIDTFIEAPNFGTLSLQALALGGNNVRGLTSWAIRQIGLPFDNGWRADNTLGNTNLLLPDLSRRSGRLALPGVQVIGASTVWRYSGTSDVTLGVSAGEPGRFEGFPQARFVGSGGRVSNLFVEAASGPWAFASSAAIGENILPDSAVLDPSRTNEASQRISVSNFFASGAYTDKSSGIGVQINAVNSGTNDANAANAVKGAITGTIKGTIKGTASGVWADTNWRNQLHRHEVSLFYFQPDLQWLDRPLASDLKGAAYRYGYNTARWDINTNIETFDSVSGKSPHGWYSSVNTRYQIDTKLSYGGGMTLRDFGGRSSAAYANLQWLNSLGSTRLQVDATNADQGSSSNGSSSQTQGLTLEHALPTETALSLSTSLSLERMKPARPTVDVSVSQAASSITPRATRATLNAIAIGLNARFTLTDSLSMQANVRARQIQNVDGQLGNDSNISLNIGLDWQISQDWSFNASAYENRGVITEPALISSPLSTPVINRIRPNDRGIFMGLRYSARAGSAFAPIGGRAGSGTGNIEGSVYLDTNANNIRDASEAGAANVVIVLDGRFTTRTDATGSYKFTGVASGTHMITVVQDDLPLPWTVEVDRRIPAIVSTRGVTRVDVGAKRMP